MQPEEPRKEKMSRSTIIAIAVIVIILVAGGSLLMSQNNSKSTTDSSVTPTAADNSNTTEISTSTPTLATSSEAVTSAVPTPASQTVSYTDSGFSPKLITVDNGTTVTFVNQSSRSMWVASDPHPTHTELKGFDELTGVASGQSYSFTFTQTGNWGYHNHLRSGDTGSVIVQ